MDRRIEFRIFDKRKTYTLYATLSANWSAEEMIESMVEVLELKEIARVEKERMGWL